MTAPPRLRAPSTTTVLAISDSFCGLGGIGESAGAGRRGPEFLRPLWARLRQGCFHAVSTEIGCVHRRARLLAPGFVQTSGVNGVKAQLVDKLHHGRLRGLDVSGYGKADPVRRPWGPAVVAQVRCINVVEGLDHRAAELLRNPLAFRHPRLDRIEAPVAL